MYFLKVKDIGLKKIFIVCTIMLYYLKEAALSAITHLRLHHDFTKTSSIPSMDVGLFSSNSVIVRKFLYEIFLHVFQARVNQSIYWANWSCKLLKRLDFCSQACFSLGSISAKNFTIGPISLFLAGQNSCKVPVLSVSGYVSLKSHCQLTENIKPRGLGAFRPSGSDLWV